MKGVKHICRSPIWGGREIFPESVEFLVFGRADRKIIVPACLYFSPIRSDVPIWFKADEIEMYRIARRFWHCTWCNNHDFAIKEELEEEEERE